MHRLHHADRNLDVTSGPRFHPFEAAVLRLRKAGAVFALDAPVEVALAYEIARGAMALFTHANPSLPGLLDRAPRPVIVTPDLHRVHHSVIRAEAESNYGNILSAWGRLLRQYVAAPDAPLTLGLAEPQDARPANLAGMLALLVTRAG